jgi:Beta-propeller repeat
VRCPGSTWEPTPRVASGVLIALMLVVPSAVMQTAVHSVQADTPLKAKVASVPGWFSTYLGGRGNDAGVSVAVDAHDNVYVAGTTQSTNFPTVHAIQGTNHFRRGLDTLAGTGSAFVTAMSPAGRIIYSTYLGGRNGELTTGIRLTHTAMPS